MEEKKTLLEHIDDLRKYAVYYLTFLILFSIIGYLLNSSIIIFLLAPLEKEVYYNSPTGSFDITLNISILFGFLVTLPILLSYLYIFIAPAFNKKNTNKFIKYSISSFLLTILGVLFAYYVSLPATLYFLMQFGSPNILSLISADKYFTFIIRYLAAFALLFQLPVIMLIIHQFYTLKIKKLLSFHKYIFLLAFILAAIITPTADIINQLLVASPILLLFYISLLIIWINSKKTRQEVI